MTIYDFENVVSLLCTIAGLLYCVFKYIKDPRPGYRFLIGFFLADFWEEYFWTVYVLVMRSDPDVSGFVTYLGWNIAIVFLLLAAYSMRRDGSKRFFHPLILVPVLINIPQFLLYIRYSDLLNNIWQVCITTLTAIFCLQELLYYSKHKEEKKGFPLFSLLVILFLITEYGMWTASCFYWNSELSNPYFYFTIAGSVISIFFAHGAGKHYRSESPAQKEDNASDLRLQILLQAGFSILIVGGCVGGYFIAAKIKDSLWENDAAIKNENYIVIALLVIAAILILLVMLLLYVMTSRYRRLMESSKKADEVRRVRLNFVFTVTVTLALMVFAVIYNNVVFSNASVVGVYENGENKIKMTATDLENYLTVAETTLRVAADSVGLMVRNGRSPEDLYQYLIDQTTIQSEQFDENFTGIYAYINGRYMDGSKWIPPEDYEPTTRDWYKTAVETKGDIVIVSPYVDAQTGSVVITIAKCISEPGDGLSTAEENVVCLDVIVNHIKQVTEEADIAGKGYGLVVNNDGFIIAHHDEGFSGKNINEVYSQDFLDCIINTQGYRSVTTLNGESCTVFVAPIMEQWYAVIVVNNSELFEDTYSQLAVNILVSFITFCLISFFYYIGYRNETQYGKKVEEMNLQVVSALATAIDAKDTYTNGHSSRVAGYSRMIAERYGYSEYEQDEIYMMGLLHDVGKIGVPDEVINKTSRLTDEEFELIKKHPVVGADILGRIKERPKLAVGARWHHERFGGGGYPDGISGNEIPEEARIIAVADAYDAMTSRRSYRDIMPQEKVRSEIEKGMGTQFDPQFARIMLQMIDEDKNYDMREK